jgi:hypothetical protein
VWGRRVFEIRVGLEWQDHPLARSKFHQKIVGKYVGWACPYSQKAGGKKLSVFIE